MSDLISRQAAIDLADELKDDLPDNDRLSDMVMSHNEGILEYQTKLSLLPSVTPAEKQEPCEDCISRQAAIDAMYALCDTGETLRENPWRDNPYIDAIIDALDNLPPVTPQQKTGRWIALENDEMETVGYYCSECDLPMETEQRTKFCPNCGQRKTEVSENG